MRHSHHSDPRSGRLRRWLIGAVLLTVLAVGYGVSLSWFAHRLGDDIEKSLRSPSAPENAVPSPR